MKLAGEAGDVDLVAAATSMQIFRSELDDICSSHDIPMERIFNANQTGLYHQKLPNNMYFRKNERSTIRGSKIMKDKNRITVMVCTSAAGDKVHLAVIGKAKRPTCWDLCGNKPPIAYNNQDNAWFDRTITVWWILKVFINCSH